MMYRDELMTSLNGNKQSIISKKSDVQENTSEIIVEEREKENLPSKHLTSKTDKDIELEENEKKDKKDKDTNWTQLLLGKLK